MFALSWNAVAAIACYRRVRCTCASQGSAGVSAVYKHVSTRGVQGHCSNIVWPTIGDVLVLDPESDTWMSSLVPMPTGEHRFSLTLSQVSGIINVVVCCCCPTIDMLVCARA